MLTPYLIDSPRGPARELFDAVDAIREQRAHQVDPVRMLEIAHYYCSLRTADLMAKTAFAAADTAFNSTRRMIES